MSQTLRFVLDGDIVEIENPAPTRSVLQYLREDLGRLGTKEGCAEGDCGACTVVLAELTSDTTLTYKAANACIQFLPTLHGKALFTVESLNHGDELHPIQQAMVDKHASQCGFCTPGFVMSLYAHYQSDGPVDRRSIDQTLSGNLCRCTGYRPIIDAASSMYAYPTPSSDLTERTCQALRQLINDPALTIETNDQSFQAPINLDELATAVEATPQATLLAGGTDAGLWVTKQHRHLAQVISLGRVTELRTITENDGVIDIGSGATLSQVLPVLTAAYPELQELFIRFASLPIRNAATLGGNVANGSPIGDSMPALLALDAQLVLRKGSRTRTLDLCDFYHGYQHNDLAQGEFLERIHIPKRRASQRIATYKLSKRFDQDISAVCAAFSVEIDDQGKLANVRIAFGGMAATPARASKTEQSLVGSGMSDTDIERATAALAKDFAPISDMRASREYRAQAAANLLKRFLNSLSPQNTIDLSESVYTYGR